MNRFIFAVAAVFTGTADTYYGHKDEHVARIQGTFFSSTLSIFVLMAEGNCSKAQFVPLRKISNIVANRLY